MISDRPDHADEQTSAVMDWADAYLTQEDRDVRTKTAYV